MEYYKDARLDLLSLGKDDSELIDIEIERFLYLEKTETDINLGKKTFKL